MQERFVFRELLSEIKVLADQKGNQLTTDEVRHFFENAHLTDEQMEMVFAYLTGEKIRVIGYQNQKQEEDTISEDAVTEPYQENDFLDVYCSEIDEIQRVSSEEELKLFQLSAAGDQRAKNKLTEQYLKTVYDLSHTYLFGSVSRGDLIQEGNIALMLALEELEISDNLEEYQKFIYEKISEAMEGAVNEYQDIRDMGEKIAERVNHLNEAIQNLEKDLEHKVSVEELSAYLEMPLDEIKDILKMAGDGIEVEKKED